MDNIVLQILFGIFIASAAFLCIAAGIWYLVSATMIGLGRESLASEEEEKLESD